MKKVIASVLAGLAVGAPMALASSAPAQAAPYANCTQAKQNGDCDIPSSSDKYQSKLDRDGDGLGCEC
ncbi:MAG: excalibur calcium-binding domain-containing protein [Mycobacteriaceae bacterium]